MSERGTAWHAVQGVCLWSAGGWHYLAPWLDELGPGDVVSGDQNYSWHSDPVITDQEPPARLIDSSRYGHPSRALLASPRTVPPTPGENHQSCTFLHDINNPTRPKAAVDG
ncbi:hypothetical protein E2C01_014719 [Portunus trituberculatus]|uniref:Uncharacterized protein n=1 Tax=Portunus trituberculatus TaxID=210409 RepID=A0A5B7DL26_PORTR|nr:hypothetical protein [Portunus trituberculatus]